MNRVAVNTVEEYAAWTSGANAAGATDAARAPTLLQVGSDACTRCPDFSRTLEKLHSKYQFRWAYNDAHNEDTDLPEYFSITKLPAFVLKLEDSDSPLVVANASIGQVEDAVRGACTPVLKLDEDF
jgi:thiol-disulfide isomerase/thioredoxin